MTVLAQREAAFAVSDGLSVDSVVSPFNGITVDGRAVAVLAEAQDKDLILYWMSPSCIWCQRNETAVKALADRTEGRYTFIAVSSTTEGLKDYAAAKMPARLVVGPPPAAVRSEYRLAGTPTTIVIRRDRHVARVWVGAYTPDVQTEIEQFFQITLPKRESWAATRTPSTPSPAATEGGQERRGK